MGIFFALYLTGFIANRLFGLLEYLVMSKNQILTAKLLKLDYRYHKLRKTFSKFYRRHYDLVSKFNTGLKSLLKQGLSEFDFYGDKCTSLRKLLVETFFFFFFFFFSIFENIHS